MGSVLSNNRAFHRLYPGWQMNLVTSVLTGLAQGYTQSFSVFFKPISSDLGLSRASTSVAASIARFEGGLESPITGWLSDRFGSKWVMVGGTLVMGTGLVLMGLVVHSAWAYFIVWGVIIATGNNLGFTIAVDKALTNWFVKKRGLAFGVRFATSGIIQVIILPLISWLTVKYGWQITSLIWAGVIFAGIPFTLYYVKQNRPEYYGLLPDGAKIDADPSAGQAAMVAKGIAYAASVKETEFTLKEAIKTSSYWMLIIAWAAFGIAAGGFNIHCIPFLTDRGIEPAAAAAMMSLMVFFTIPSRFLGGFLADRVGKERLKFLLAAVYLLMAVGISFFLVYQTTTMIYVLLALWGLGSGAHTPLGISLRGRYYGRKAYGSIQGTQNLLATPISLAAPIYSGWVYDVTGSYITAFKTFAAIVVFAAIFVCFIRIPKIPNPPQIKA